MICKELSTDEFQIERRKVNKLMTVIAKSASCEAISGKTARLLRCVRNDNKSARDDSYGARNDKPGADNENITRNYKRFSGFILLITDAGVVMLLGVEYNT